MPSAANQSRNAAKHVGAAFCVTTGMTGSILTVAGSVGFLNCLENDFDFIEPNHRARTLFSSPALKLILQK
jgi:hypothetical protein